MWCVCAFTWPDPHQHTGSQQLSKQAAPTPTPPHAGPASHWKHSNTTPLRWKRRANIYRWGEGEKRHRRQAGGRFLQPCSGAVGKFLIPPSLWFICPPDPPCEAHDDHSSVHWCWIINNRDMGSGRRWEDGERMGARFPRGRGRRVGTLDEYEVPGCRDEVRSERKGDGSSHDIF